MLSSFLLLTVAAATALARPGQIPLCANADDEGGALTKSSLEPNGQFIDCFYANAGLCTYFAPQGSFSSGSSVCPDSITPASGNTPMDHLIKVGADGLTYTPSSISAAVGDTVTFEFHPKNHTVTQSSFEQPCKPLEENGKKGFKSGFQFVEANAINFPTFRITVNDTQPIWGYCGQTGHCSSGMVFAINAVENGPKNFAAFQARANATATAPPNTDTAQCVATDDDGGSLLSSSVGPVGFVTCNYSKGGVCQYFAGDGSFSSGSSVCPDRITPPKPVSAAPAPPNVVSGQCVARDDDGGSLLSSSIGPKGFVTCTYSKGGVCQYFEGDGSFSSGSSVCPDKINPATGSTTPPSSNTKTAKCVAKDDDGGSLLSSSVGPKGFVTCTYSKGGVCQYFEGDGSFSSGSSVCPDSITPPSVGVAGTFLSGDDSDSTGSSSSNKPQPILIALLAINGVLVIAVIIIAALYIRSRRSGSQQMRGKYITVTDTSASASVPLTLGDHGPYYDPHDRK